MAITIRPATPADRSLVLEFHRALYDAHRKAVMPAALDPLYAYRNWLETLAQDVDALLASSKSVVLLAFEGDRACGYISGHLEEDRRRVLAMRGVIEDWYVDPALRGQGVGKKLYVTIESIFREAGCEAMESATWPFNDGARRAHEALGFHEIEVRYRKVLK